MITSDLEKKIQQATQEGKTPMMVNSMAGTTVLGAYDPLEEIADICNKYKLWMHVDVSRHNVPMLLCFCLGCWVTW